MSKLIAPKGTRDIYAPDMEKWHFLETHIRTYFERYFYREIRTPIFEHSDLFQRGIGSETEVVQKEMYTFTDKGGRSLTLRPENTASVVRAMIENNLMDAVFPLRFYYIGPMFRYDKPQKGRFRQFHQFGIEVFGDSSPQVDGEVIYSAMGFLSEIGITGTDLHINSVGCRACRPAYLKQLSEDAAKIAPSLCQDCQRKVETNPLRIFDCKNEQCIQAADSLAKITDHLCPECNTHFQGVQETLHLLDCPFSINPKLVRGLDYYTKTAFEITSQKLGAQDAILGGGRYDDLFQELGGPDFPGIGFAAGMERIILHLDQLPTDKALSLYIAYQNQDYMGHALALAQTLWKNGYQTYLDYRFRNLKKQLKRSVKLQSTHTIILGEDEISSHTISIKDMEKQTQVTIKKEELLSWLKKNQ